jgi:hypothetical protein
MIRRTAAWRRSQARVGVVLVLATLALVAMSASAAVADGDPPAACATGAVTTARVQEVNYTGADGPRVFLRLEGWIGPCTSGAPLPAGFRRVPYYEDGSIAHFTPDPDPFTSTTGPTTFGEYIGVDTNLPSGSPLVGVCLAYDDTALIACVTVYWGFDGPSAEAIAPSEVQQIVLVWPPATYVLLHPNPTCGTCP